MSYAIGHFAIGAVLTYVLLSTAAPTAWFRWPLTLTGGAWGVIPDATKTDDLAALVPKLHSEPWVNLFWGHGIIDAVDPLDSPILSGIFLCGFIATVTVGEYARYRWMCQRSAQRSSIRGVEGR